MIYYYYLCDTALVQLHNTTGTAQQFCRRQLSTSERAPVERLTDWSTVATYRPCLSLSPPAPAPASPLLLPRNNHTNSVLSLDQPLTL